MYGRTTTEQGATIGNARRSASGDETKTAGVCPNSKRGKREGGRRAIGRHTASNRKHRKQEEFEIVLGFFKKRNGYKGGKGRSVASLAFCMVQNIRKEQKKPQVLFGFTDASSRCSLVCQCEIFHLIAPLIRNRQTTKQAHRARDSNIRNGRTKLAGDCGNDFAHICRMRALRVVSIPESQAFTLHRVLGGATKNTACNK